MGYSSNERRAERRQECREALSAHIYDRLRLHIPPARVRLQPSHEDGYAWAILPSKQHLLSKTLASCTVGVYQEIMDELGESIEAIFPQSVLTGEHKSAGRAINMPPPPTPESRSFTEKIEDLEECTRELNAKLENSQNDLRESARLEEKTQIQIQELEAEVRSLRSSIENLEGELEQAKHCIRKAARTLEESSLFEADTLTKDKTTSLE